MYNICVFAGTTEGRRLVELLASQNVAVTACMATEYAAQLLGKRENLTVSCKRLDLEQMVLLLGGSRFDIVIDATHPYAAAVTDNIVKACSITGTRCLRLQRPPSDTSGDELIFDDARHAADFLSSCGGSILLTTGTKDLAEFSRIEGFERRVFARVLPSEESLAACRGAGLPASHIIAMQGPFSADMNCAAVAHTHARFLVTKDGGDAGGFAAKAEAAQKTGVRLVVIGRPAQIGGLSLRGVTAELSRLFGLDFPPHVNIIGIGPGGAGQLTCDARRLIDEAQCLVGAPRMLEAVSAAGKPAFESVSPEKTAEFIKNNDLYSDFAVLMSGDAGFFSGTRTLLPLLDGCKVDILPGISSLSYLCSRIGVSYEDVVCVSLHGRERSIVRDVRANPRVFVLTGGENDAASVIRRLAGGGLGRVHVTVGQSLSYPDEKITAGTADELLGVGFAPLSVLFIENDAPSDEAAHGLVDEAFIRANDGPRPIPMTKSEIRSVILSKLAPNTDSVCWDIGAGTGSVAVEMALHAKYGKVFAVERSPAACGLIEKNRARFCLDNMTVVNGGAPQSCTSLPAPTHVFIGGSSGNMEDIIASILEKSPSARITASAVTLDTAAELTRCMKRFFFDFADVVSLTVARAERAGGHLLMKGGNPVYIFTMQKGLKKP